ncbi:MAG: DUF885 domain-containing protein [Actinomycetota bacterium]
METSAQRDRTAIDDVADDYLDAEIALDPIGATALGIPGHHIDLTDYSPAGHAARHEAAARALRALSDTTPLDEQDRITIAALRERLGVQQELYDLGADDYDLNVLASPVQALRSVYDLMPQETPDHWADIATRLTRTPQAIEQYVSSLRRGIARGTTPAMRQVRECAQQATTYAGSEGFFASLAAGARDTSGTSPTDLPHSVHADLTAAASVAAQAYQDLARFLLDELAPAARDHDAVGRDEYALRSRYFLGASIDLDETYAWGVSELTRIEAEMADVAQQIHPGATVDDALRLLDEDPARRLDGTEALQQWMQTLSDAAIAALADTHFDIPEPVRRLECRIAPTHEGGIYYTGPSEDFSRPGRMWWSVPLGEDSFSTWRETTTVYHEGVPGHHLQVGQTVYRSGLLNRWRRLGCWVSGHGEGWALYAERLMADLGFLDDPGDRMGMLSMQRMRAARVVLDIGVHCGLSAPAEYGGEIWNAASAAAFFRRKANLSEGMLAFEINRYLGWPGQAPSYKVGERLWTQLRDAVRAREGDQFNLATFHRRALDMGSVGLDVLQDVLLSQGQTA